MLIQRPQNLTAKIKKTLTTADVRTFQFKILSNKEANYLSLAISQVIEKIFTQKLKTEEFEGLQAIISAVFSRGKNVNLNESAKLLLGMVENKTQRIHWKMAPGHEPRDFDSLPSTCNLQGFELEKPNTSISLQNFLRHLIKAEIGTKISPEQKTFLLDRLDETKKSYPYNDELNELISTLKVALGCEGEAEEVKPTMHFDPAAHASIVEVLTKFAESPAGKNLERLSSITIEDVLKKLKEKI